MSDEFRSMLIAAGNLDQDESAYEALAEMGTAFQCKSTAPLDLTIPADAPRAANDLVELCTSAFEQSELDGTAVVRAAREVAVRAVATTELWVARRCGALRRGGHSAEANTLWSRTALATRSNAVDWSDADSLAEAPWLMESIDGNVSGVIFNYGVEFAGFGVTDLLRGWTLSLVLDAARTFEVSRCLALMSEACQAMNFAGYMDGWDGKDETDKVEEAKSPRLKASFSDLARLGANARHASSRIMKEEVIAWWTAEKGRFASKDAAAIEAMTKWPIEFSTARGWLKGA